MKNPFKKKKDVKIEVEPLTMGAKTEKEPKTPKAKKMKYGVKVGHVTVRKFATKAAAKPHLK